MLHVQERTSRVSFLPVPTCLRLQQVYQGKIAFARVKETQKHKKEHYFPGEPDGKVNLERMPIVHFEIKRVVRLTNNAEQDYEDWVYDVKPPMPWFDTGGSQLLGKC